MKKMVKILGVGSARDREMMRSVEMAALEMGLSVEMQLITDIETFLQSGISAIPAMVIEDKVVTNGRIPGVSEIKMLLREASMVNRIEVI